ncbi:MAG: TonB-dependent receptor [Muribaculaceae bacterium]|nr:TonB-dependent receptor [Muribaculaceae bacterium]
MRNIIFAIFLLSFALAPAAASEPDSLNRQLDELLVTGSNAAVPARLMPYTVSVVGRAELEEAGSSQLLSIVSGRVPSLFVTERGILGFGVSSNGGSGHIKMRGIGGDRASAVLMMLDGQPQFAGIYSHHVADFYTKDYVERVEVLRGPASVLYGSNAMAGTINVITRKAKADGVHGSLTSEYGSFNTWQTTLSGTARYGAFSALASVSYDRTDGNVEGFDFKQWSGYGKVGYDISNYWKAYVDFTLMNFKAHDPIYPTLSDPASTDVYYQSITRGEASAVVSNVYGSTDGVARVYYNYGNHFIDDPRHFHSVDDRLGVLLYQNVRPWQGASATIGFDFATYSGKIPMSGGRPLGPDNLGTFSRKSITEYSPYITYSQQLFGRVLVLNGGVRMANSDKFGTRWVPQGGFALNIPGDVTVKASAASGYRNPSFRELYLYRMANPDLRPERMWNYEVSVGKAFGFGLDFDVTAYFARGSNMIQTLNMKNLNTGSFINKGIEVSARYRVLPILHLNASYSYLHTSLANLAGAPRNQYYLGAEWQASENFLLSAELKGVAGLYVDEGIARQNYALVNAKATFDLSDYVQLFVRLENIANCHYVINRGYDMPGLTGFGGFRIRI